MTGFVPASHLYDGQTGEPTDWDWNPEELDTAFGACARTDLGGLERVDAE